MSAIFPSSDSPVILDLPEQGTEPSLPPANTLRLYAIDDNGLTALIVAFPSGTRTQVAEA